MKSLRFYPDQLQKAFKPLHATNGGPWTSRPTQPWARSNFLEYEAARIPYSRNHDSNLAGHNIYGSPYVHDIHVLFPDFDADENDPASYDFACTDANVKTCLDAGCETFFRLGESIEHQVKKHGTIPPKDFQKWARICEHVIRHYTEGWADGLYLNIQYWEIWNEPDLGKNLWDGTKEQFFEMFEIAAKHLKRCFPHLKIGGPALAKKLDWAEDFLSYIRERGVPLNFFSWHIYCTDPLRMTDRAERIRALLDLYGYQNAESICNEWNYLRNWGEQFIYSIDAIRGIKGASFVTACICEAQKAPVDMLMYYDTRPGVLCGIFDYYTCKPQKPYYPFYWYGTLFYRNGTDVAVDPIENLYTLCRRSEDGSLVAMITHYSENDDAEPLSFTVQGLKKTTYEVYILDAEHNGDLLCVTDDLSFTLPVHACLLIKERN